MKIQTPWTALCVVLFVPWLAAPSCPFHREERQHDEENHSTSSSGAIGNPAEPSCGLIKPDPVLLPDGTVTSCIPSGHPLVALTATHSQEDGEQGAPTVLVDSFHVGQVMEGCAMVSSHEVASAVAAVDDHLLFEPHDFNAHDVVKRKQVSLSAGQHVARLEARGSPHGSATFEVYASTSSGTGLVAIGEHEALRLTAASPRNRQVTLFNEVGRSLPMSATFSLPLAAVDPGDSGWRVAAAFQVIDATSCLLVWHSVQIAPIVPSAGGTVTSTVSSSWNLLDDAGHRVANGAYLFRLVAQLYAIEGGERLQHEDLEDWLSTSVTQLSLTMQRPVPPTNDAVTATGCCLQSGCPVLPPLLCMTPSPPTPTESEMMDADLHVTRPRVPITEEFTNMPPVGSLIGDQMAWLFDHPFVRYVVRGKIESASARDLGDGNVATLCTMSVLHAFKGDPGSTLQFQSAGANTNGLHVSVSHKALCNAGEEVIAFVGELESALVLVGSDDIYAVAITASNEPQVWGEKVDAFIRTQLVGGGP